MARLSLRGLTKAYGSLVVVHGIDLEIAEREFVVLVGPSGCGKSTTLRMIAGLESISGGEIRIGERRVNEVSPGERDIAMVFQNYALYPHMTVAENIAFGLKQRRTPRAEIVRRVAEAAALLEIEPLLGRKPRALSGGQRQRVAMGRAIVRQPQVFLFDEPLSNLDAKLRGQMRTEIKRLHGEIPTTTVYVTHDQVEAMTLADRVVVMNGGRIEQVGPPQELYHAPATRFVAGFIGSPGMNMLPVQVTAAGEGPALRLDDGTVLPVPSERAARYAPFTGRDMLLGLRPEHLTGFGPGTDPGAAPIEAEVQVVEPMGMETLVHARVAGQALCARFDPSVPPRPRTTVRLAAQLRHMHLIDPQTDRVV